MRNGSVAPPSTKEIHDAW